MLSSPKRPGPMPRAASWRARWRASCQSATRHRVPGHRPGQAGGDGRGQRQPDEAEAAVAHPADGERAQQYRAAGDESAGRAEGGGRHGDPGRQQAQGQPQRQRRRGPGGAAGGARGEGEHGGGGPGMAERGGDLGPRGQVRDGRRQGHTGQRPGTRRGDRQQGPTDPARRIARGHGQDRQQHAFGAAVVRGRRDQGPAGAGPQDPYTRRIRNVSSLAVRLRTGRRRHARRTHPAPRTRSPDLSPPRPHRRDRRERLRLRHTVTAVGRFVDVLRRSGAPHVCVRGLWGAGCRREVPRAQTTAGLRCARPLSRGRGRCPA